MTSNFTGNAGAFVPLDYLIPVDELQARVRLRQYLNDIAAALNVKDTGYYSTQQTLCGQLFLPVFPAEPGPNANTMWRPVRRMVVPTDTLSTGSNNVPHNIPFPTPSTYTMTRIYGVIFNAALTQFVPVPNSDTQVIVDTTNIVITIPAGYNGYTGNIVLEWITQ